MKKIIIAIDGYAACGKSTTAKAVASELNYTYLDSGAMYRAVTLYFIENHINITDPKAVAKGLQEIDIEFHLNNDNGYFETFLNGLNVEGEIRRMEVSEKVSDVSALPEVRKAMVAIQHKLGKKKGIVMDGRDIGTYVFPDAELKIFMVASMEARAFRRQQEFLESNYLINLDDVKQNLIERDQKDTTRQVSPLKKAEDAIEIDTTHITIEEQVEKIIELATGKMVEYG